MVLGCQYLPGTFADENFKLRHSAPGLLSMVSEDQSVFGAGFTTSQVWAPEGTVSWDRKKCFPSLA